MRTRLSLRSASVALRLVLFALLIAQAFGAAVRAGGFTYSVVHNFQGLDDGGDPLGGLTTGIDGSLYGTTCSGGAGYGTLFRLDSSGTPTPVHTFGGAADGACPSGNLVSIDDGIFGTTSESDGGVPGTLFKWAPGGTWEVLHAFTGADDGANPGGLVLGSGDVIYGFTTGGGTEGAGTLFRLDPDGTFTSIHSFQLGEGSSPSGLVIGDDGFLYGTTLDGPQGGTVFKMNTADTNDFETIYTFSNGERATSLVLADDGRFYGTTSNGGANGLGTVFGMTNLFDLTTLHEFNGDDGAAPEGALFQASGGLLYGTTRFGGSGSGGTIFRIEADGALTTVHAFDASTSDGAEPVGRLVEAADDALYGTTFGGGAFSSGVVFSLETVTPVTPDIAWATPADIPFGTRLSTAQLNATATVGGVTIPGTFEYTPASGTLLSAGANQTLSVTFTPTDTSSYAPASATTFITVTSATPTIAWQPPASIVYGTALSGTQLNATATADGVAVPGTFAYTPVAGTILHAGASQILLVTFTPFDSTNYSAIAQSVSITVTPATPVIDWPAPADVAYGTAIDATQLNATANTPGNFVYTPASGTLLPVGTHPLALAFAPANSLDYVPTSATNTVTVTPAPVQVTLSAPGASRFGDVVRLSTVVTGGDGVPTGNIEFFDGSVSLGTMPLTSGGGQTAGALLISALGVGSHTLTAVYNGAFGTANSNALALNVTAPQHVMRAWGSGSDSELGNGTAESSATPVSVNTIADAVAVSAGGRHVLALRADGSVWAWGANDANQLGTGGSASAVAVPVTGLSHIVAVAAGANHSLALQADGTVLAWGRNAEGQLGLGADLLGPDATLPTTIPGISGVVDIAAGATRSVALRFDGTVWAWGSDPITTALENAAPTEVAGLTDIVAIGAGGTHQLAIDAAGAVWAWGDNSRGQLGLGIMDATAGPVRVLGIGPATAIAAGGAHSLAVDAGGVVWTWGANEAGELGNGSTDDNAAPAPVASLATVVSIAGGVSHSAVVTADGSVWTWGANADGELGIGVAPDSLVPTAVTALPAHADRASAGRAFTLAFIPTTVVTDLPAIVDFGTQAVGSQHTQTLTLSGNTTPLAIFGAALSEQAASDFSVSTTCPTEANTCDVTITFTPTQGGPRNATLTLADNAADSPQTIALTGNGAAETTTITWPTPAPIVFGTALSATQLDATAAFGGVAVPGTFAYTPTFDTVLDAGLDQALSVTFTPTDGTNYTSATASVLLTVTSAMPILTWPTPAPIVFGTALSAAQLDATATFGGVTVPGAFAYTPTFGVVLDAGVDQTLSVTFTPTDSTNYTSAASSVLLTIAQATPVITWPMPAPIVYGTALSSAQLNATTGITGSFSYSPTDGTILSAGTQLLTTTFTPADGADYSVATLSVSIVVGQQTPVVTLTTPVTNVAVGQPVVLMASVTGTTGMATGTVTFTDNAAALGTSTLDSGGHATFTATLQTPGVHSIVASFGGDANFTSVSSTAISITSLAAVTTYHNDLNRTGANVGETILNTTNVAGGTFGKLFTRTVDGQIYAQPLYVPSVAIPGQGTHNVVFVATEHNVVYAFDADDPLSPTPLWSVNFGAFVSTSLFNISRDLVPEVGITGTPVIDLSSNTIYAVAETYESGSVVFRLHALDLGTGAEKFGGPVEIQASVAGTGPGSANGIVTFDPYWHWQRPGLLLLSGSVYVAFGSHADDGNYQGWLIGYNASTLAQTAIYCSSPNAVGSGFWQGGGAPAADANGNIYIATGNGLLSADSGGPDYGDSLVKLNAANGLGVVDYFSPSNQADLAAGDLDFGTQGPMLIPGASRAIVGGKDGRLFVLNTDALGHFNSTDQAVQTLQGNEPLFGNDIFYNSNLYIWSSPALNAFHFDGSAFDPNPISQSVTSVPRGFTNTPAMSLSANGTVAGTGIIWTTYSTSGHSDGNPFPGVLRAFDASNVAVELWNSEQLSERDGLGSWAKWSPPTVAGGKVYVGTFDNALAVYGLLRDVVAITGPTESTNFSAPATIALTATANDSAGVERVEFYQGSSLIGTATASPYGVSWTGVGIGSYTLSAKVYDRSGGSGVSAPVHVLVTSGGTQANFLETDTSTQGGWIGTYGVDGYEVINDTVNYPAYATVAPGGQASYTWAGSTADVRALAKASGSGRLAAAWYGGTFTIDVNLTDGAAHQLSLYLVDWDNTNRVETIEVRDAGTNALLDSRSASNFAGGQYWRWTVSGHVTIRVTANAGPNAVVSGVFFDPSGPANTPPTVSLTGPAEGASYAAPAAIALTATASDSDGINRVEFYQGTTLIGTPATTSPYGTTWSNAGPGAYTLTAKAYDSRGAATVSAPVHVTVTGTGGTTGPSASFLGTDTTTQGSWIGTYGTDGYQIINDSVNAPAYATVAPSGQASYTWAGSTVDVRALAKASGSGRLAAAWYGGAFTIDIDLTDGAAHQLSLYLVDWDNTNRVETIEVRDAGTNAVLDSQLAAGFHGGQYWRWTVSGHVTIRIIAQAGDNAVVHGLFFDPSGPPNTPPTVSLTGPAEGASYAAPAAIALTATASDSDGINRVEFYQGTTLIGTPATTSPYGTTWSNAGPGAYTLTAKAYDSRGAATVSAPVHVTVTGTGGTTGPSASFLGTDTTTQGSWIGTYGTDGYQIINDSVNAPAYATVAPSGQASYTWAGSTVDVRALAKASGSGRLAAAWYGGAFTIDVNLTDGAAHQLSLYLVDWDNTNRVETIEVRDAGTNALLDSRSASNFAGGQYWRWTVSGHVTIRIIAQAGDNAVVHGLFFDPSGPPNTPPTVSLTGPAEGASYAAPAAIALTATASDSDGINRVEFYQGTTLIGMPATTSPYGTTWSNAGPGAYTLTAKAYDSRGAATVSAPVHVTVTGTGGTTGPSTSFLGTDTTTQGSWIGTYGTDGYQIINDSVNAPAYATVAPSGQASYTWAGSTADVRALAKASGSGRLAAAWYGGAFTIDIDLTDGAAHQLSLYLVDWDNTNRVETIEVRDAGTNAVLDSQLAAGFHGGQYWRWTVSGHVTIRIIAHAGDNAVVNGLFFDP